MPSQLKKLLFLCVLIVSFSSSQANSMTVEDLYGYCKPHADSNFGLKKFGDVACAFYFKAVYDNSRLNCHLAQNAKTVEAMDAHNFVAGLPPSVNALIQSFVNWAAANPSRWEEGSPSGSDEYNFRTWPCITD